MKNLTLMTCTMPEVQLPSDFEVHDIVDHRTSVASGGSVVSMRGGEDDGRRASLYIGLQFDNYNINLTATMPDVTFQFFQQPTFDSPTDVIIHRPETFSHIDISVRSSLFYQ